MSDKLVLEGYLHLYDEDIRLSDIPSPDSPFDNLSLGEQIADAFKVTWCKETGRFEYGRFRITVEKLEDDTSVISKIASAIADIDDKLKEMGATWDDVTMPPTCVPPDWPGDAE